MNKELYDNMLSLAKTRRTTKLYDNEYNVDADTIKQIYEFALTAPHSMGLELARHITFGNDSEYKEDVAKLLTGFNHVKGLNASHIGVTITKTHDFFNEDNKELVDAVTRVANFASKSFGVETDPKILEGTIATVLGRQFGQNDNNGEEWMAKQGYIQLGYIILAATALGVDTTIMEGYEWKDMTQYLRDKGLINSDERVSMTIAFGKKADDPKANIGTQQLRRDINDFWTAK